MAILASDAIVLRTTDFSESSLIVTLFTKKYGKIEGIAKGAKRLKNPFESALDLLAQISVLFISKDSGALDLLTEASLQKRFRPHAGNLAGLYAAYYLTELLTLMTEPGTPLPRLYSLAEMSLNRLEEGKNVNCNLLRFEWGLLQLSGSRPSLNNCIQCGTSLSLEDRRRKKERVSFALVDGGVVCPSCRARGNEQGQWGEMASVTPETLLFLDSLDLDRPESPNSPSSRVLGEARGLTNRCLCDLLGRKPRMHNYMRLITSKIF